MRRAPRLATPDQHSGPAWHQRFPRSGRSRTAALPPFAGRGLLAPPQHCWTPAHSSSPSPGSRSFPESRQAARALGLPGTWSARKSSPARRSAGPRKSAASVSSCHPCPGPLRLGLRRRAGERRPRPAPSPTPHRNPRGSLTRAGQARVPPGRALHHPGPEDGRAPRQFRQRLGVAPCHGGRGPKVDTCRRGEPVEAGQTS